MNLSPAEPDTQLPQRLHVLEQVYVMVTALIAITILVAWLSSGIASLLPHGWDLMKVNTAIGMLLATVGLWLSTWPASPRRMRMSLVAAAILILLALLVLLEHVTGAGLRIDTLLAADVTSPKPGLTSAQTATGLFLLGLMIPSLAIRRVAVSIGAEILTFALIGFTLMLLSGYVYGAAGLLGESSLIRVSPQTLTCFVLLTLAAVSRRAQYGVFHTLFQESKAGRTTLIAAPLVIVLIYITGFFYIYVRQNGFLSRSDGVALSVAALSTIVLYVILLMATRINRLEQRVRDVLEKRSQVELHQSQQRYAELVDQALEGITVRKPSGEFLFVNDAYCHMLGFTRAELLTMKIRDVVHPEDAETITQVHDLSSGSSLKLEKRMRRKDGRAVHVEVSVRRLQDGNIQSNIQDISERKHGEERFKAMVEGAPNAMVMVDERGMITLANPQTRKLFGYDEPELLGKPIEMLIPERFRRGHPALRAGYNNAPQMRSMGVGRDLYGLRKDGKEVPVEIGLNPIATHDGRFVLASIIDITERRAAEHRERAHLEELTLMSQRLLEAQETERRAIARELHDEIGQALTAARMNMRELEKQAGDGPLAQQAADASAIVAALLQQVRQLSLDMHPTVLDDLGLAAALRWLVRTRVSGGGPDVALELTEDLPRFTSVVEHTVFRVFQEALSNVLRHSGANKLEVKLAVKGDRLLLDIRDNGKGFDPEAAHKHALAGNSLGVIGMQERVRLAEGRIVIESNAGQGTLVRVSLPAVER